MYPRSVLWNSVRLLIAKDLWVGNVSWRIGEFFEPSFLPTTCFDGSEIRLPQGYTKGRRPETPGNVGLFAF
jgi:hypothetical protein